MKPTLADVSTEIRTRLRTLNLSPALVVSYRNPRVVLLFYSIIVLSSRNTFDTFSHLLDNVFLAAVYQYSQGCKISDNLPAGDLNGRRA
jgi:hypothetical protein